MTQEQLSMLTDLFQVLFNVPDLELRDDLTAREVPGWDSFGHIQLIIQIEEEFGIRFTTEEVTSFQNVGELMKTLDAKLNCLV